MTDIGILSSFQNKEGAVQMVQAPVLPLLELSFAAPDLAGSGAVRYAIS
jgi:hypothetical protein